MPKKKPANKVKVSNFLEICNLTKASIVINSCNLILKPMGQSGDRIIVEKSKTSDGDIVGLHTSGLIEIIEPGVKRKKTLKSIKKSDNFCIDDNKSENNKMGSSVTYIDRGKVRKGKMQKHISETKIINLDGTDAESDGEDKPSEAFVDD